MLIREEPATLLTVATRILAHALALAPDGRVALLMGEVVYLAAEGISCYTMTPYDVTIVRLRDGLALWGVPPHDAGRYLDALAHPQARAAALASDGTMVTADSVGGLIRTLLRRPWDEAEADARAAGALIGAYPVGDTTPRS
ncbi:MAG TPA: hypothetical protein VHG53_03955 [Candidatus Limnocylindria bacterium]|nr:hypothetical protein [Candidatus Limnocylindria bacterium]